MSIGNFEKPWLLPFLRQMSVRPGAYLGCERVQSLDLFLTAYMLARSDLGAPEYGTGEERLLGNFAAWLEQRLDISDTRGWWGLIERYDPSDTNIRTFIKLFDEFLRTNGGVPSGLTGDRTQT